MKMLIYLKLISVCGVKQFRWNAYLIIYNISFLLEHFHWHSLITAQFLSYDSQNYSSETINNLYFTKLVQ